ncbi:MAG TPA: ribosomal protein S18-alanine N-acetyltransferase [Thermoleophilia bacterium]|nr:ribosomal protein S18-alanine N-acetyltransferase [Thermoleophilia bacterium]
MIESLPERPIGGSTVIRRLVPADLDVIVAIERETFSLPWHRNVFASMLIKPEALCLGYVVDGRLIGYLIADMFVDVWHIMNLAVSPARRRRHIASDLLEHYFEITETDPHRGHTLEVRVSNEPAIQLYRSYGFVATGVRRGYYSDNREDALIMWKEWEGDSA